MRPRHREIFMLVKNSGFNDPRVIKEAHYLAKQKYIVKIGIFFNGKIKKNLTTKNIKFIKIKKKIKNYSNFREKLKKSEKICKKLLISIILLFQIKLFFENNIIFLYLNISLIILNIIYFFNKKPFNFLIKTIRNLPQLILGKCRFILKQCIKIILVGMNCFFKIKLFDSFLRNKRFLDGSSWVYEKIYYLLFYEKIRLMSQFLLQSNAKIIHCHDLVPLIAGASAASTSGAFLIWDAHEIYNEIPQQSLLENRAFERIIKRYQGCINGFITINKSVAKYYSQRFHKLPKPAVVTNATLSRNKICYDGRLHRYAGLPKEQRILLYQGGFAPFRGLENLISTGSFLVDNWTIVLMGGGKMSKKTSGMVERINRLRKIKQAPIVKVLPPVRPDQLPFYTCGATAGVIPYENAGLNHLYCTPNKLWEYPAAGVPIFCTPLYELKKMIDQYKMGWLIPHPFDPKKFADKINHLSEDEIKKKKYNCDIFTKKESWIRSGRNILKMYKSIGPNPLSSAP